jgi:hypothetical protein
MGALLAVAFVVALRASLPPESPPLTLAAAVDEAMQNNPTLIAFRAELDVLRAHDSRSAFSTRRCWKRRSGNGRSTA